jgi:hypothetical protein
LKDDESTRHFSWTFKEGDEALIETPSGSLIIEVKRFKGNGVQIIFHLPDTIGVTINPNHSKMKPQGP